ncbi:hypothetical protein CEP54_013322 [Fusarium duplospermum]|uniref:Major facilitator superfamily (MFS) profile domain-containing protein n=1 Tax=Fusarium duplospermum TaxID=1325734 RepID=A0A428P3L5_9HYPO|nr:hypothetical protein CEP54_013322 [Fusarium duplospermum]
MAYYATHPDEMPASFFEYSLVGGLSISAALIISPLVTIVRKRIGLRLTLILGSVFLFLSLITSSLATKMWQLFLSQGVCFGVGMGLSYISGAAVLPPWFTSRRSLAVGCATSGVGIGGLVYSIATNILIEDVGIRLAYRILGFCGLGANLLAAFLLKERGGRTQPDIQVLDEERFDPRDFGRIEILLLIAWGFATDLGYVILLYSLPTYASSIGLTPTQGATSSALLNLGLALSRPLIGYISDSFGRINIAGILTFLCTISCFALWLPATTYAPLLAFSLIGGALCGVFWCTITPVMVEVVGIRKLASTFRSLCIAMALPTIFGGPVAMQIAGSGENLKFTHAQLFVGFMFLTGSHCVWLLRCWQIFKVEMEQGDNSTTTVRATRYWVSWLTPRFLFSSRRV